MEIELFEKQYERELNRRHQLTSTLSLPLGVLTILGGALGVMAKEFSYGSQVMSVIFSSTLLLAGLAFAGAVFFIVRSYFYFGHSYSHIPAPGLLKEYHAQLLDFYQYAEEATPAHKGAAEKAEEEFAAFLRDSLAEATDINTRNNDLKAGHIHLANLLIVGALISTALCGIPYAIDARGKAVAVHRVYIENLDGVPAVELIQGERTSEASELKINGNGDKAETTEAATSQAEAATKPGS